MRIEILRICVCLHMFFRVKKWRVSVCFVIPNLNVRDRKLYVRMYVSISDLGLVPNNQ